MYNNILVQYRVVPKEKETVFAGRSSWVGIVHTKTGGRAESTKHHRHVPLRQNSSVATVVKGGLPEQMIQDEVEGEKLQEYILTAGHYFANRGIARFFNVNVNEDLEPSNPENLHCLLPGTLVGYMVKHLP